jgi:hypothetical protein
MIMTFTFNPEFPDATNEQKWQQIRNWRSGELSRTDWTQLPDSPADKEAWATYRQALRDLPDNFELADDVVFPTKP